MNSVWFDLDGTIFDTVADIKNAYRDMFAEFGRNIAVQDIRIGPPLRQCILEAIPDCPDEHIEQMAASFCRLYDNSGFPTTVFYPGFPEILHELKSSGKLLFIATNKRLKPTCMLLELFGINHLFTGIYSPDSFPGTKLPKGEVLKKALELHKLSSDAAVMIGDTASDILAGHSVNMKTMAVTWGYENTDKLKESKPDYIISAPVQIPEYLNHTR